MLQYERKVNKVIVKFTVAVKGYFMILFQLLVCQNHRLS